MPHHEHPKRMVLVSNRLPVNIVKGETGLEYQPSAGGLATALDSLRQSMDMLWVGWPGIHLNSHATKRSITAHLQEQHQCVPVFLPAGDFERFYSGFSNGCIWPLFHYFPQYATFDAEDWKAYRQINRLYCERLLEIVQPGDYIWVHDYQLMLLPSMLREAMPDASIAYFHHIPFPSLEILRILPWREEILKGLLGADLIGFHTYSYARHFFSSLLRLLGLEHRLGRLLVGDRFVRTDVFPLGVDVARFAEAASAPAVQAGMDALRKTTNGRKLILSVDRLDFTKGIPERLTAFERFLEAHPEWHDRVTMIQVCVPSRTRVPRYVQLKRQVDELVGRVNGRFGKPGWVPIWYLYRMLSQEELAPLYAVADVALVTPLRDGMNLVAKEYIASRQDELGTLILSETAGAAEELGETVIVNPHDNVAMAEAIQRALLMPPEEQRRINRNLMARLRRYDTSRWAGEFLNHWTAHRQERARVRQKRLEGDRRERLLDHYRKAAKRLFFLDYDGTLVGFAAHAAGAAPDMEILRTITALAADARNTVVIISGRDHTTLEQWLGATGANLVAEHGARRKAAGASEWHVEPETLEQAWRTVIYPVLEVYADRTPGAYVEDKGSSLVWHYRQADPEMGSLRAKELMDMLASFVANTSLQVMPGNKVVEVKPGVINKGRAVRSWLCENSCCDFIMAVGDDVTDEDMFQALPENAWTIKVGVAAQLSARFYLSHPSDVRALLAEMCQTG